MNMRTLSLLALSLALVACGSQTTKPDSASTTAGKPAGTVKKGGYYLDDGPEDNPPANIDSIPDAIPRVETISSRASRPYSALGKRYEPMTAYAPYKQRGIASWYGKRYHGQKTSSGELYDMYSMTGAHTILPLPSYVRVTNTENGRSVIVRINDRGPFHSDRLIDLSYAAAYKLRLLEKGSGPVEVEAIDPRNVAAFMKPPNITSNSAAAPAAVETQAYQAADAGPVAGQPLPAAAPAPAPASPPAPSAAAGAAPGGAQAASAPGMYVQVGAYRSQANAEKLSARLRAENLVESGPVNSWYNEGLYRVRIGPYTSRAEADRIAAKIKQALSVNTYVIIQP